MLPKKHTEATARIAPRQWRRRPGLTRVASHPPTTTAIPKKMNAIARPPTSELADESRLNNAIG